MPKDPRLFPDLTYYVTLTIPGWTDVFVRHEYRDEIIKNLRFCQENKGLLIYSFCLMTSHMHMIVGAKEGQNISDILRNFKSFTGKRIIRLIEENTRESRRPWLLERFAYFARVFAGDCDRQFWDRDNYSQEVRSDEFFLEKQKYILENPVRSGFVMRPEDWLHSSACPEFPVVCEMFP